MVIMKKEISKIVLVLGFAVSIIGCNQDLTVTDGQLPNEFLPAAQKFVGTYQGQMEHHSVILTVNLDGNRLLVAANNDLVDAACQSKIGVLKSISYQQGDNNGPVTLSNAIFAFDPNLCGNDVSGRELKFTAVTPGPAVTTDVTLDAEILDHVEIQEDCEIIMPPYPNGGTQRCTYRPVRYYREGRFVKQ